MLKGDGHRPGRLPVDHGASTSWASWGYSCPLAMSRDLAEGVRILHGSGGEVRPSCKGYGVFLGFESQEMCDR